MLRKRKTNFKKFFGFDCNCPVCLGQVSCQDKILKKLIELYNKLDPSRTNWKREAGISNKIVELTMELYIGGPIDKMKALGDLARFAYLARDNDLVKKAMDKMRQLTEDTKLELFWRNYDDFEKRFSQWSKEFNSGNAPEKREIDSVLSRWFDLVNAEINAEMPEVD